jgi:hypothetical protein
MRKVKRGVLKMKFCESLEHTFGYMLEKQTRAELPEAFYELFSKIYSKVPPLWLGPSQRLAAGARLEQKGEAPDVQLPVDDQNGVLVPKPAVVQGHARQKVWQPLLGPDKR